MESNVNTTGYEVYKAFDNSATTLWRSNTLYSTSSYTGTLCTLYNCGSSCLKGDYLQITVPNAIRFLNITMIVASTGNQRPPSDFAIFGTNNVDEFDAIGAYYSLSTDWAQASTNIPYVFYYPGGHPKYYRIFRFVFMNAFQPSTGFNFIGIKEFTISGYAISTSLAINLSISNPSR